MISSMCSVPIESRMVLGLMPWGNPSSLYRMGQRAKEVMEDARKRVAVCIAASPEEITFTSIIGIHDSN